MAWGSSLWVPPTHPGKEVSKDAEGDQRGRSPPRRTRGRAGPVCSCPRRRAHHEGSLGPGAHFRHCRTLPDPRSPGPAPPKTLVEVLWGEAKAWHVLKTPRGNSKGRAGCRSCLELLSPPLLLFLPPDPSRAGSAEQRWCATAAISPSQGVCGCPDRATTPAGGTRTPVVTSFAWPQCRFLSPFGCCFGCSEGKTWQGAVLGGVAGPWEPPLASGERRAIWGLGWGERGTPHHTRPQGVQGGPCEPEALPPISSPCGKGPRGPTSPC